MQEKNSLHTFRQIIMQLKICNNLGTFNNLKAIFIPISNMEKQYTNFGQKYVIEGEILSFLIRRKKENFFEKSLSVRPFVRKSYVH